MKFAQVIGALFGLLLFSSVPCWAAIVEDDCLGTGIQPKLYNFHVVNKKPAPNIEKAGYYEYINAKQQYASAVYQVKNVKSIEVFTYTTVGTFFTIDATGNPIRGQINSTQITRMLYAPSIRSVLAPFNGTTYYCLKGKYNYKIEAGADVALDGLRPYGLNVEVSRDGINYRWVNGLFIVKVYTTPKIIYQEEHSIDIPSDTEFIRLSTSHEPELDSVPLKISKVRFNVKEPEPPPPESSSSSSSSSKDESSSISSAPSSSSSSSSSPSAVALTPKQKPPKRKKRATKDSHSQAEAEPEEGANEPIRESTASVPPSNEEKHSEPKQLSPPTPQPAVPKTKLAEPQEPELSPSSKPVMSSIEVEAEKHELTNGTVHSEEPEEELRLSDKIFLTVYVGSLVGFFTVVIFRPASRGRRTRKKGPKILP